MNYTEKGSKAYLFSIVLVAVIGGLLFGYDTAVISGAEKGLQAFFMGATDFAYTDAVHGITSSSALLGCIIGSAISGFLASRFGRKKTLFVAGLLFLIAALGTYDPEFLFFEHGKPTFSLLIAFNIYRIIGGVGVGLASAICPMYIAEIAPSNIRGTLVSWNQFAIISGQLIVYIVNFLILGDNVNPVIKAVEGVNQILNPGEAAWTIETGWRLMFLSAAVPAGIFSLLVLLVPETPRYLAMSGKDEKALSVLSHINGLGKAKEILADIKATAEEKTERLFTYGWLVIFVGIMLSVFQQAVGINAVLYFAPRIFETMGMGNPMVQTVFMGIVNLLFTLVAVLTVERVGRRPLLITGSLGMAIGAFGVAICNLAGTLPPIMSVISIMVYSAFGGGHRSGIPVDIQLHRVVHVPPHLQHEHGRHGREVRPHVCLRHVWHHLHPCRPVRMEACPRDQGQDPGGHEQAVEEQEITRKGCVHRKGAARHCGAAPFIHYINRCQRFINCCVSTPSAVSTVIR